MFTPKMRDTAQSAEFKTLARLPGHILRFNKHRHTDGSGKGNIVATGNAQDEVWGVIFEIADADRKPLDDSEGGYDPVTIDVVTAAGWRPVLTYVAKPHRMNDGLKPYTWYKEFIVRSAKEHGLPAAYIQLLEAVDAIKASFPFLPRTARRGFCPEASPYRIMPS